jgi:hypothetical protein
LGYILGNFFTNSSGHPAKDPIFFLAEAFELAARAAAAARVEEKQSRRNSSALRHL